MFFFLAKICKWFRWIYFTVYTVKPPLNSLWFIYLCIHSFIFWYNKPPALALHYCCAPPSGSYTLWQSLLHSFHTVLFCFTYITHCFSRTTYILIICPGKDHWAVFPGYMSSLLDVFQPCAESQSSNGGGSMEKAREGKMQFQVKWFWGGFTWFCNNRCISRLLMVFSNYK